MRIDTIVDALPNTCCQPQRVAGPSAVAVAVESAIETRGPVTAPQVLHVRDRCGACDGDDPETRLVGAADLNAEQ